MRTEIKFRDSTYEPKHNTWVMAEHEGNVFLAFYRGNGWFTKTDHFYDGCIIAVSTWAEIPTTWYSPAQTVSVNPDKLFKLHGTELEYSISALVCAGQTGNKGN